MFFVAGNIRTAALSTVKGSSQFQSYIPEFLQGAEIRVGLSSCGRIN
jgi:hypothetical protein